jgi:HNH endonuclease
MHWYETIHYGINNICLYCGTIIVVNKSREHVFPESWGGQIVLPDGIVCDKCNLRLGNSVDSKVFREPLLSAPLLSNRIPGKNGMRNKLGKCIFQTDDSNNAKVSMRGATSGPCNDQALSRSFCKVTLNYLSLQAGSSTIRANMMNMIKYVTSPRDGFDIWPMYITFCPMVTMSLYCETRKVNVNNTHKLYQMISLTGVIASLPFDRNCNESLTACKDHIESVVASHEAFTKSPLFSRILK